MTAKKTCLTIGGGRGMGAAIAKEMHQRGYQLALMSPSESCEILATNSIINPIRIMIPI